MKATILDVAAAAGVSVATVSRVINGNYSVKPATADRVRTAAAQLQYVPNIQARELNQQRSSLVGVIVTDLQRESVRGLLTGIEQELRQQKKALLFACSHGLAEQEQACIADFSARNVAGILLLCENPDRERRYDAKNQPCPLLVAVAGLSADTAVERGRQLARQLLAL